MSLQVWLPLNGNLENKGIASISTTNTPIYVDGKMGKAINLTSRVKFYNLPKLTKFTITFWAKVESCTADWADLLGFTCKQADDSNAATFRFEATTSSRACSFHNNAPEGISTGSRILIRNYNEWHHVAVSYNGEKLYSYIDGSLTYIDTGLGGYLTSSFHIGESPITGAMNDLRIYDECLSKEQIHQISQGLILHYPLNSGYGNENLLIEGNKRSSWTQEGCSATQELDENFSSFIKITSTAVNQRIYRPVSNVWTTVGEIFTVSFYAKTETNGMTIDLSRSIVDFTDKFSLTGEWKRYVGHIKVTSSSNSGTLSVRLNSVGIVYIANIKLERGEIDTFYAPNENDVLYTTLGYNSTTVYDTSGFGNNGTMVNNVAHTSDTPLYDSSINLQKANSNYINLQNTYITNQSTINFWGKVNTFGGWQRFFEFCNVLQGQTGNHRILLGTSGNTQQLGLHIYGGETGTTSLYVNSNITTIDTNWHMYSIVFNKTNLKVFMDGKSIVDATMTQELTSMVRQYSYIGKSSYSADSYFNGNISDFRIYSTALLAEDIKQLYESRARIDKSGNLYCNQFVEMDNERNLLDTDDYWISGQTSGTYKQEKIECSDSSSGTATKITCTAAGSGGFYMAGHKVFDKTNLVNGKQYIVSLYVKSDNRTSVEFFVECASKQTKNTFTIGTEYKRINIVYTYSNTTKWNAFTSYGGWKVDENVYIHSIKVTEYNPKSHIKNNSVIETNSFIEIKSEEKCKIYKQDIQSNEIIEI